MVKTFRAPREVIEQAVDKMKKFGLVHPKAQFNKNAQNNLRREVAYRDDDFLYQLGKINDQEVVDAALSFLKSLRVISKNASYDQTSFLAFHREIKDSFKGSWTSLTPTMERLLYMLTSVRRPQRLVEFGSFWGNTLAWFSGPCIGRYKQYNAEKIYGIDIDPDMTETARRNFGRIEDTDCVELLAEDALAAIERIKGPFDFVYIEAKSEESPELYLDIVRKIEPKLAPRAWVIAHDIFDYTAHDDMESYKKWVRNPAHFKESIAFDVDNCGLELSIRE